MAYNYTTGYVNASNTDIGNTYVTKDYLISVYPSLPASMIMPTLSVGGFSPFNGFNIYSGNLSSPTQVGTLTNWSIVNSNTQIQVYASNAIGTPLASIKQDGSLWVCGYNSYGQLGLGDTITRNSPVQVGTLTNWSQISISGTSMAIKTDGTLWSWGYNNYGQLGLGNTTSYSSPVQVGSLTNWSQVAGINLSKLAIKTDGTLWAWGYNGYGQLGQGNTTSYSSPVQVGTLTNWSQVAGNNYTVNAIKTDGTLWSWGANVNGSTGQGTTSGNTAFATQVGVGTTWSAVACGYYCSYALQSNGTLWSFGTNANGATGLGTSSGFTTTPTQVGVATNWAKLASGAGGNTMFAINTSNNLYGWGSGTDYQVGNGSAVDVLAPTAVGGATWLAVCNVDYAGGQTSMGIQTNGTLWTWGSNQDYCTGFNTSAGYTTTPTQVGVATNWSAVAGGGLQSAIALRSDGTAWAWGLNVNGTTGTGGTGGFLGVPTQIGAGTNWVGLQAGVYSVIMFHS